MISGNDMKDILESFDINIEHNALQMLCNFMPETMTAQVFKENITKLLIQCGKKPTSWQIVGAFETEMNNERKRRKAEEMSKLEDCNYCGKSGWLEAKSKIDGLTYSFKCSFCKSGDTIGIKHIAWNNQTNYVLTSLFRKI
jgi:hypothetical protein